MVLAQIRQAGNTTMIKTKTKTLGVIGGLGPMATAYYMELCNADDRCFL